MNLVDWRDLYASNQASIQRAGGVPSPLPTALQPPARSVTTAPAAPLAARLAGATQQHVDTVARARPPVLVHVPRALDTRTPAPVVCMLHGCTQHGAGFAAATRMNEAADRHGFIAVYPEQDAAANQQGCWNWFLPEHQSRGAGEPARIATIVRELIGTTSPWTIDTRRVFVAGFSAGAAMATILVLSYPDLFAAVAVHSGLPYRSASNLGAAFAAMANGTADVALQAAAAHQAMGDLARPIPSIVIHGTADRTVAPINGRQVLQQLMSANQLAAPEACEFELVRPSATSRGQIDGGHPYTRSRWTDPQGALKHELLEVHGLGHAWSGGAAGASHTDPRGPNATEAIWRFFQAAADEHRLNPTAHRLSPQRRGDPPDPAQLAVTSASRIGMAKADAVPAQVDALAEVGLIGHRPAPWARPAEGRE
jgi:poly(hydroxyalkanoate) depolymerase family esterase